MTVPALVERLAREAPELELFRDARRSLSASATVAIVDRLAQALRDAGLRAGDRLLIVAENDVTTPVLMLATQRLGAWPALVNARVGAAEFDAMCACTEPRLVAFATESTEAASLASRQRTRDWQDCAVGPLQVAVREVESASADAADDAGLLLFTSGTTGRAKAVMWSHAGLLQLGRVLARSRATTRGSVVQCAGPLSHIMGMSNCMAALAAGATLQLMPRLDAVALADAIRAGRITHLSLVPTAYRRLCEHLDSSGRTLAGNGLRYISSGGAPLDATLKARVEQLLGLRLVNGYGMTECAPGSRTRPDRDAPADCIGWPEEGVEMKIDAPPGDTLGELLMRSATRMTGYYGAPAETAAVLRPDGWIATGDLAEQRPDGAFRIVGRRKELIIRSGFNVYPAEVEAALDALPGVRQSAVVGRVDSQADEEVVAFVQVHAGVVADAAALRAAVSSRLAPYKRPSRIGFVDEFPLGPTGKILKQALRDRAASLP